MKQQQHVLITGGTRGIGAEVARRFAINGYAVTVFFRSNRHAATRLVNDLTAQQATIEARQVNVCNEAEVQTAVREAALSFGAVDVLVSNAGVSSQMLLTDAKKEDYDDVMDTNLRGLFHSVQAVLPGMVSRKTGRIITVSSVWGITGASCEVLYSAAKAGVIGFTKALAKEVGQSGILVNCVAPGLIDTQMNRQLSDEDCRDLESAIPLERMGTPREVADVIYFLASASSSYMTGQVLSPNGGFII